jgi:TIR domain
MRFVKDAHKCVTAFISHASEDNEEAKAYQGLLCTEGFDAWQYGRSLNPGEQLLITGNEIRKRNFFLLLISKFSLCSDWVQRELGLACQVQRRNRGFRPFIIPVFCKNSTLTENRPPYIKIRNFKTAKPAGRFSLAIRGLDKYTQPVADADDVLLAYMKPSILISRLDIWDEDALYETRVFDLYRDLFSPEERDSEATSVIGCYVATSVKNDRLCLVVK